VRRDQLARTLAAAPARVVRRDVDLARVRAGEIVDQAQGEAKRIIAEAEARRQAVYEAASRQGKEEGLKRWNEILATATARADELVRSNEPGLIKLAVRMAEKIIGDHLRADPATLVGIVAEAMKSAGRQRSLTIQVHPDAAEMLRGRVEELRARVPSAREIWVEENVAVPPGGCIVQSEIGSIDAKLETQLRCLETAFLQKAAKK
jgi:flagellar biosynthesis/type III secretory pathway protein FliH